MKKRILSIILAVIMIVGVLPIAAVPAFAESGIPAALQNTSWKGTAAPSEEAEPIPFILQLGTDSAYFTYQNKTVILPFYGFILGQENNMIAFRKETDEFTYSSLTVYFENENVLRIMAQFSTKDESIFMVSNDEPTECITLRDIIGTIEGMYSFSDDSGNYMTVKINENEFLYEIAFSGYAAEKTIYNADGLEIWSAETFEDGKPVYGSEAQSTGETTIDMVLNTEIKITEEDTTTGVPAGSYVLDLFLLNFAFYDEDEESGKTQKLNFNSVVLDRVVDTEPKTLRDIIGKVGGVYSLFSVGTATVTLDEDRFCLEEFAYGGASRIIIDDTGTKTWETYDFDEDGQPVYNDGNLTNSYDTITIDVVLDREIAITKNTNDIGGFIIPAGSYSVKIIGEFSDFMFFDEQSGKTQHIYLNGLVLNRIGDTPDEPVHEHTFSEEWSNSPTHHWHDATCEHTELSKNLGEHTFGTDGKCTVCGYEKVETEDETAKLLEEALKAMAELEKQLEAKQAELEKLNKESNEAVAALNAEIESLNSQLDAAKKEIERLKAQSGDPGAADEENNACSKCGGTHADNFFGQIICFFNRIINWFKNLF